jgi:uncharacterized repeat protein (TIGR02543 family)
VVKGKTLAEPNAPVKEGGTFEGWYKEAALTGKITFPHTVTADIALYAKWTGESGGEAPGTFTSIAALKAWLENQPDNTAETPYKVALKGVNLDADNGWNELGVAVKGKKIVELDLSGCTGTAIPDGSVSFQGTTMTTKGAFVGCGNLVAVTLPESLKTIGDYVFFSCANLASVTFPQGLTAINRYAFSYCTNLASVALPGGLRKIGASAFAESGLASISIPNSVDEWTYAFTKCTSLTSVVLEEGIESVPQEAFWQCSLLTSVNLPSSIKTIGDNAFFRCGLESITIPQGVTSIGESAFEGCKLKELVLPEGLISIGEGAFRVNRQLLAVSLPAGLKTIGAEAFRTCDALVSLSIPEGIQSIGKGAFSHCEALVNLSLPDGLKVLTANSFEWCTSLKSVTVPASVTSIENYVFSNCKALEELVMLPVTPPAFISTALTSTSAFQRIKVPAASVTAYKAKVGWMAYKDKIVANE